MKYAEAVVAGVPCESTASARGGRCAHLADGMRAIWWRPSIVEDDGLRLTARVKHMWCENNQTRPVGDFGTPKHSSSPWPCPCSQSSMDRETAFWQSTTAQMCFSSHSTQSYAGLGVQQTRKPAPDK